MSNTCTCNVAWNRKSLPGSVTSRSLQDLHTCRRIIRNTTPIELYGFTKNTREKFERALRKKAISETDAKIMIFAVMVVAVILFALYGVVAAASNFKFEQRTPHNEKVWAEHTRQQQR